MARNFLITGADEGVGKTMAGCALAFAFKVREMRVGVMKPIATGCIEADRRLVSADGAALVASASADLPEELVSPYRYRETTLPRDSASAPSFDAIVRAYQKIAACSDVTIVEDGGGLATPIDERYDYADLALELKLELVLVAANRAAFVDQAKRSIDYAAQRRIPLSGFILNALDQAASANVERDAEAVTRATGASCLGTVRFKQPLSLAIVERLLRRPDE